MSAAVQVELDVGGDYAGLVCRVGDTGIGLRAMSANASASDGRSWIEAGMDGCLTKPVTRAALAEALTRWGRTAEGAAA